MKNSGEFSVKELNREDMILINGDESTWYKLAREAKILYNTHTTGIRAYFGWL